MGAMVAKSNARKVRRLGADGHVVAGIAGATADAMTLLDRLEQQVECKFAASLSVQR
jgi:ATP-dependent HslUV protease subunit HslV